MSTGEVTDLSPLVGTWTGTGRGEYPTIATFAYEETTTFAAVLGKPYLTYEQRTVLDDGRPSHRESGFVRPGVDGGVEWVIAQPTGHAELSTGTFDGRTLDATTTGVVVAPTAKEVRALHRRYVVDGDVLRYEVAMAAVGLPLQAHLSAELRRTS
jgi:hypothetical protein